MLMRRIKWWVCIAKRVFNENVTLGKVMMNMKRGFFKKIIMMAVVCIVLVKLSVYGWIPNKRYQPVLSVQEQITAQHLEETVTHLSVTIGHRDYHHPEKLKDSARYVSRQFEQMGYTVRFIEYEAVGQVFQNIVAQHPRHQGDDVYVIGAHYDSCSNPGADDNASGVAGMIEMARLLKDTSLPAQIKFVAFVNEEPPFFKTELMGSRVVAKHMKANHDNIKLMMALEMIGYYDQELFSQEYPPLMGFVYPNRGNFIAMISNMNSHQELKAMEKKFKQSTDFPVASLAAPEFIAVAGFSDHWSFWQEGYPALMVTDTAFMRTPHYHQANDVPETLDFEAMAKVVHGLAAVMKKGAL